MAPSLRTNLVLFLLSLTITTSFATHSPSKISYAALGDSYATGPGAGHPLLPPTCGRFSAAYPILVANSTHLAIDEHSGFRNLACGGASTHTVLALQAPWIGSSDVATLTVGGNEVDFFPVLDSCVYQWRLIPVGGCEAQLQRSREILLSGQFIERFERVVKGTAGRMREGARLLVTGYATFFNEETEFCDGVSFSRTDPSNLMTRELRRELNGLVRLLNDVIRATAAVVDGAEYVDIDTAFEGHRLCEDGVAEPDPYRKQTWFFGLGKELGRRNTAGEDWPQQHLVFPKHTGGFVDLTKVFHPTALGHEAIADVVVNQILWN